MMLDSTSVISVNTAELAELIRRCRCVDVAFGPGWARLTWRAGEPMPEAVRVLAELRGVEVPADVGPDQHPA